MGAQFGGFNIAMSGDGLEVTLDFEILYQFEKYEKNVGKICNPSKLLF
jgi:hypothetical protein